MGTFLAEVSFDQTGIINAAIDHRRGIDAGLQYNGLRAASALLGNSAEAAGSFRRKREVHLTHTRIRSIASFDGAAQVAAGDDRGAAQDVPAFGGVEST